MEVWKDELYHHGIKGQRWGIRRFQNPDGTYTTEGKLRRNKGFRETNNISPEIVGIIGYLGAVGVLSLSSVAVSKGKQVVRTMRSNKSLDKEINSRTGKIDPETGLHFKSEELPLEEDAKHINPGVDPRVNNSINNCTYCAVAAEVRRRGYDVSAGRLDSGRKPEEMREKYYPDSKEKQLGNMEGIRLIHENNIIRVEYDNDQAKERFSREQRAACHDSNYEGAKYAIKNLIKEKNSSGILSIKWGFGGGHSTSYRVENGVLTIVEGQTGHIYTGSSAEDYLAAGCLFSSYRLDNVSINYDALIKDGVIR